MDSCSRLFSFFASPRPAPIGSTAVCLGCCSAVDDGSIMGDTATVEEYTITAKQKGKFPN